MVKLAARRYFPRTLQGARLARQEALRFAHLWFCGTELDEVESAVGDGLSDALYGGTGAVIILAYGRIAGGMAIEIRDSGSCYTRFFKRLGEVALAQEA